VFLFRFAAGVNPRIGLSRLKGQLPDIAVSLTSGEGEVGNLERIRNLPVVLAGLLALIAAGTLVHTLLSIVRRRERDMAILRTLGFVRTQVWATVAWQGTTLVVIALLAGIPLGIGAVGWGWTVFANQLGVGVEPIVRPLHVLLVIPAALVLGNVIAAAAARSAARIRPSQALRSE